MTLVWAERTILRCASLPLFRRAEHIMGMPAAHANWTVDMLDALPDDPQRYEIIDGTLHVTLAPSDVHQLVVGALYARLRPYLRASSLARAISSPSDVRRGDHKKNRVQPDIYAVRLIEGKRPPYPFELRDLLLVIEVQSPSNPTLDYQIKRRLYLSEGVPEYWIVNPDARVVSRWRHRDDPGDVLSERIEWHPQGMASPLIIDLPDLFDDALA